MKDYEESITIYITIVTETVILGKLEQDPTLIYKLK